MHLVEVKFKNSWMGNPKGSIKKINNFMADTLESRGTVKIIVDKKKNKQTEKPENNKMMKSAPKKKAGRPKKKK